MITAWEVIEHIHERDLPALFTNISNHLAPGGYFVASTTDVPDVHEGVDLHQTKWTNDQWRAWLAGHFPELEPVELGLKFYQYVRYGGGSYLTYRKK